jgi:ribosomal-protein-serine acetyltransferase
MVDESLELRQTMPEEAEEMFAVVDADREYLREWLPWLDNTNSPDDETVFISGLLEEHRKAKASTTRFVSMADSSAV